MLHPIDLRANIPSFPGTGFPPIEPSPNPEPDAPEPNVPSPIEPDPYPDYRDVPPTQPID
ncbi:MAG TPA: hypothetical protein VIV60_20800 [Polyangiaceae bacterium]